MRQSTEKEMLELAAKAAGYSHLTYLDHQCKDGQVVTGHYEPLTEYCINPLTDDGDRYRLIKQLEIVVNFKYQYAGYEGICVRWPQDAKNDAYAAVMVAAEIGLLLTTVEPRNSPKRG